MKIVSIVGARPEFVQIAALSRAIRARHEEILIHTGQHHDNAMSGDFFRTLNLPAPDHNLNVGSVSPVEQVALVAIRLGELLPRIKPDWVVVRGDTNSTLGGALAAAKTGFRLAHVEAGERSGDRTMPEEMNRLIVDRIADLHLCASRAAVGQLAAEGITRNVHWVGDVMLDAMRASQTAARRESTILRRLGLEPKGYSLLTLHRQENVESPARLRAIVDGINRLSETIVFPVHPRTRERLSDGALRLGPHVRAIEPAGYLDMIALEEGARLIATDSGGVQREAYFLGIPCLTLRDATEWRETVEAGWNRLVAADALQIVSNWSSPPSAGSRPPIFGEGFAAAAIADILDSQGI